MRDDQFSGINYAGRLVEYQGRKYEISEGPFIFQAGEVLYEKELYNASVKDEQGNECIMYWNVLKNDNVEINNPIGVVNINEDADEYVKQLI